MSYGHEPLLLTDRQRQLLEGWRNRRKTSVSQRTRIDIVLGAHAGQSNASLARRLNISRPVAVVWRQRWLRSYPALCTFEQGIKGQGVSGRELLNKMLEILQDAPRSGKPKTITLEQEQQITALACTKPEEHGLPLTQWNRELLAQTAKEKGIVEQISPRYVGVILKKKRTPTS